MRAPATIRNLGLAAVMLVALSACAETYQTACVQVGTRDETADFPICVQRKAETAPRNALEALAGPAMGDHAA